MFDEFRRIATAMTVATALFMTAFIWAVVPPSPNEVGASVLVELENGHGSGVHIGHGVILTAAHVVDGEDRITVRYPSAVNQTIDQAEVIAIDKDHDLAWIKVTTNSWRGPHAELACDVQRVGTQVRAVGNPFDLEFVSTWGHVSSDVRKLGHWLEVYVINIVSGPGMSGGGVFDIRGRLVGTTVGGLAFGSVPSLGYSFTVPSSTACRLMGLK